MRTEPELIQKSRPPLANFQALYVDSCFTVHPAAAFHAVLDRQVLQQDALLESETHVSKQDGSRACMDERSSKVLISVAVVS